jgi:hypothetical protein
MDKAIVFETKDIGSIPIERSQIYSYTLRSTIKLPRLILLL